MRKTTAPLALGLMAAASLVQAQDLKGEVSIWSWNIAASSLESVAKDFMAANPGVKVTTEDLGNQQVFDRMLAACAAGGVGFDDHAQGGACLFGRLDGGVVAGQLQCGLGCGEKVQSVAVGCRCGEAADFAQAWAHQELEFGDVDLAGLGDGVVVASALGHPVGDAVEGLGEGGQFDQGRTHVHVISPA